MAVRLLRSSRAVLWAGFGGLLAIIILMAAKGSQVVSVIQSETNRLLAEHQQREDLLDGIRFSLSESASDIRDYLLDRDPSALAQRRDDLQKLRQRITEAVERYGRNLPADEAALWAQLQRDVDAYWNALAPSLHWNAETRRARAEDFLQEQVIPRQGELLALTAAVDRANQRNLEQSNRRVAKLFRQFRLEMAVSAIVALVLGGLLALLTITRMLALERSAGAQLREVARARSELQNLSRRLVAAQEEERRRVARELHDEIGQALSAILVELGRLEGRLPPEPQQNRAMVAVARQLADRATAQVRDMALLLRPSMLDDLGLVPALQWQAREVSRRTGVKVKVAADTVADDLPDEYRTCVYRIVQEAVNNAARHAHATTVRVDASQEDGRIRVSIQDNGAGFNPKLEKGMGILGMEERVKKLGGAFRIDSEEGAGTIVSLLLPLSASEVQRKT
ncbi:MAG TPA: histidine kinase [Bryobacteraceae bacterium]|nr:histidine kinase [Bryobacteraceae bacterium]